jgi:hypothetical protein
VAPACHDDGHRRPLEVPIATPACPSCGRPVGPDDRFCGRCGAALSLICPRCGRAHEPELTYCTGCGASLRSAPPLPLARAGLSEPSSIRRQEERRRVSVLFVDAVSWTPFSERSDPETVRVRQSGFFGTVRRVVHQYGGVVEKYVGDAVMVLFGAPVSTETDAVRCVRAGLDVQRALARETEGSGEAFRVGIATGDALVDVAAAYDGGQAILAGDVVNTAFRLQAAAPPGSSTPRPRSLPGTRSVPPNRSR